MDQYKIKYLVIRFSSIGDIILTTPLVRCLKQQVDNAEIHFITKEKYKPLLKSNPYIEKIHVYSGSLNKLISILKKEQFDYIIDLHNNFRSNGIKARLNVPVFTVKKDNLKKLLMICFKINRLPDLHTVERYLDTLSLFGVKNDMQGLDFFIPGIEDFNINELPRQYHQGFIAFVIAGTYNTKKLPPGKVAEICNNINYPVVLLGGKDEQEEGEEIVARSKGNIYNLTGKTNLYQSASLVRDARIVVTNDTGLMHIAAAFKKKILSFWGSTIPGFGMYPYMPDPSSKIMEIKGLKCRPCSKLGYSKCPGKHFKCMMEQDLEEAVKWINLNYPV